MAIRVIPVLDIKAGRVVAAVAGNRDHYAPLGGDPDGPSSDPVMQAVRLRTLFESLGIPQPIPFYVADLDAIEGDLPRLDLISQLSKIGIEVWIDSGVQSALDVPPLFEAGASVVILGLETLAGPEELKMILEAHPPDRIAFSLDLWNGKLLRREKADWPTDQPRELAEFVIDLGLRTLLMIDLQQTGTGEGTGLEGLLQDLHSSNQEVQLIPGGGIANVEELRRLRALGAGAALVGAALRDGRIGVEELRDLQS